MKTAHQSFREGRAARSRQSQIPRGRAGCGARHEKKPSPFTEAPGCAGTQIARGIMRRAGWQKGLPCFFMPPHGSAILRAVFRHIRHPVCTILVACQTKGGASCGARGGLFFVECGHVSVRAAAGRQAGRACPRRAGARWRPPPGWAGRWRCARWLLPPLQILALGRPAPVRWRCAFARTGWGPALRACVSTLGASLMLGGGAQALVARGVLAPLALMAGAGVALLTYLLATLLPGALCDVRQVELAGGRKRRHSPRHAGQRQSSARSRNRSSRAGGANARRRGCCSPACMT